MNKYPGLRIVVVKRPWEEVVASLAAHNFHVDPKELEWRSHMLDAVSNLPGVKTFSYADLEEEATCREIFEFCLRTPFDLEWWEDLRVKNIQIDLRVRYELLLENQKKLAALNVEVFSEVAKLGAEKCLHLN